MDSKKIQQNTLIFNIVIALLVINFCTFFGFGIISKISIALLLLLNIGFLFLTLCKTKKVTIYSLLMVIFLIIYVLILSVGISNNPSYSRTFVRIFQLAGLVCLYLSTTLLYNIPAIKLGFYKFLNVIVLSILYSAILISVDYTYSVALISDISFAFLAMNYLMFLSEKKVGFYIIAFFPLVILGGGRTHMISIAIFTIIFSTWKKIMKSKLHYYSLFLSLLIVSYAITVVYPTLINNSFFILLNQKFNYYTGENFFSGRQVIWASILDSVKENKLFGLGSDIIIQAINDLNLSAHNQYLEIYAQSGIVGLSIFVMIICLIWIIHYRRKSSVFSRFNIAFLSSLMIMSITSVCLYQTNMALASILWFIMGLGTNLALKVDSLKQNTRIYFSNFF